MDVGVSEPVQSAISFAHRKAVLFYLYVLDLTLNRPPSPAGRRAVSVRGGRVQRTHAVGLGLRSRHQASRNKGKRNNNGVEIAWKVGPGSSAWPMNPKFCRVTETNPSHPVALADLNLTPPLRNFLYRAPMNPS